MITLRRSLDSLLLEFGGVRKRAIAEVTDGIRVVRLQFVTDLPGQEMLYLRKEAEAQKFLAELITPTDLTNWPLVAAEVGITAPTAYEVAQVYVNLGAMWEATAAALETIRLGAVVSIEAATTSAEVDAALSLFHISMEAFE
ncbi:hypothetical protein [Roseobacter sp. S98]|uniref:hypothetical protein n=1 Tax=Roseobacter algicola (ex Choi et al. 2025) (nom. illeg.) TaxID=3092138 RepID=UPI0035C72F63